MTIFLAVLFRTPFLFSNNDKIIFVIDALQNLSHNNVRYESVEVSSRSAGMRYADTQLLVYSAQLLSEIFENSQRSEEHSKRKWNCTAFHVLEIYLRTRDLRK